MELENEQKKHQPATAAAGPSEQNGTERIGLWTGFTVAGLATAGVLALAFYTDYKDRHAAEQADAAVISRGETMEIQTVPDSEQQAALAAVDASERQVQGMTAPADENEAASAESFSPAQAVLADENAEAAEARVIVENGVVKLYFATGKADLAVGAQDALKPIAEGAAAGRKAVISGYTDSTGNAETNAKLSKERAFAVRDALLAAGVPEGSIELRKPASDTGSGSKDEARRVEVVLE